MLKKDEKIIDEKYPVFRLHDKNNKKLPVLIEIFKTTYISRVSFVLLLIGYFMPLISSGYVEKSCFLLILCFIATFIIVYFSYKSSVKIATIVSKKHQ